MNFTSFKIQRPMSRFSGLLLAAGFVIVAYVLHLMHQWDPLLAEEDHLMEWTQAAFLCSAGVSHFRRGRRNFSDPVAWAVFGGLALLCASFLARELDIDSWGTPLFGKTLEAVLRGLLIISWLCFARFLWKNFKQLYQAFPSTIGTPVILLTFIGGSFYLASWPFEKELFSLAENTMKFWGQLLQIFASTLFFMSSLGNTTVSVGSNATLQSSGSIGGSVTITSVGTLSAGNSIESLAMGTLTLQSDSNFIQDVYSGMTVGTQADLVVVNGDLNIRAVCEKV